MNRQGIREHFVYWLFDNRDECLYVGMTRRPEERWRQHCFEKPQMMKRVARTELAGPFDIAFARRHEREQQDQLRPSYDGRLHSKHRTLRLRSDAGAKVLRAFGAATYIELAEHIGLHRAQISRVLSGQHAPGNRFIAGVIDCCGLKFAFDHVFELVHDPSAS